MNSVIKYADKNKVNPAKTDIAEITNILCQVRCQDPQTLQDLTNFDSQLEARRIEQMNLLTDAVSQTQEKLQTLKIEVRGDYSMELRDADYYRVGMFQLEGRISQMKESIKDELCSLMREEAELWKELQGIERRVEEWGKPLNARIFKPIVNSNYRSLSQDDEDDPAVEFQKFILSSGGHSGGWEEQDHLLFLRERRKYGGKPKFISVVHCLLPDISEDEIVAHEAWYKKYETLKDSQKEAIRKWRAGKLARRDYAEPHMDEREVERTRPKNPGYHRDIAERIKEWKRQQMIKKAEEEERQREEQQRQHEERLRKREMQKSKKNVVDQYRAEKLNRLQAELLQQQMRDLQALEDRARKSVLLKAFREQDQTYIERKKQARVQSALREKERNERLENAKPSIELAVERDPQRLFQSTQVWNQHCQQSDSNSKPGRILSLHTMPHLSSMEKRIKQYINRIKVPDSQQNVADQNKKG